MENYKIYIDSGGIIKAILLPQEPNYNDSYAFAHESTSIVNPDQIHEERMRDYNAALSKAKQDAVPFKEQDGIQDVMWSAKFKDNTGENFKSLSDTIHDLPEGYCVEVSPCPFCDCINNNFICNKHDKKVATLKKISPPLLVEKEEKHYAVNFPPSSITSKEDVSEKEQLRKRFEYWMRGHRSSSEPVVVIARGQSTVFDFFYSEIEDLKILLEAARRGCVVRDEEISSLREQNQKLQGLKDTN